ncbi:hypothetical protein ACJX0J_033789, partial [Zea mays]
NKGKELYFVCRWDQFLYTFGPNNFYIWRFPCFVEQFGVNCKNVIFKASDSRFNWLEFFILSSKPFIITSFAYGNISDIGFINIFPLACHSVNGKDLHPLHGLTFILGGGPYSGHFSHNSAMAMNNKT